MHRHAALGKHYLFTTQTKNESRKIEYPGAGNYRSDINFMFSAGAPLPLARIFSVINNSCRTTIVGVQQQGRVLTPDNDPHHP